MHPYTKVSASARCEKVSQARQAHWETREKGSKTKKWGMKAGGEGLNGCKEFEDISGAGQEGRKGHKSERSVVFGGQRKEVGASGFATQRKKGDWVVKDQRSMPDPGRPHRRLFGSERKASTHEVTGKKAESVKELRPELWLCCGEGERPDVNATNQYGFEIDLSKKRRELAARRQVQKKKIIA